MKVYYYTDEMYPVIYPEDEEPSWSTKEGDVSKELWEEYLEALSAFKEAHDKVSAELLIKVEE